MIYSQDGNKVTQDDFEIIKELGKGAFGKVFLVEKKDSKDFYALKVISKISVIKENTFEYLKNEELIMKNLSHPFLVSLSYFFCSPENIFFAMKYLNGGELYSHLKKKSRFNEHII